MRQVFLPQTFLRQPASPREFLIASRPAHWYDLVADPEDRATLASDLSACDAQAGPSAEVGGYTMGRVWSDPDSSHPSPSAAHNAINAPPFYRCANREYPRTVFG